MLALTVLLLARTAPLRATIARRKREEQWHACMIAPCVQLGSEPADRPRLGEEDDHSTVYYVWYVRVSRVTR